MCWRPLSVWSLCGHDHKAAAIDSIRQLLEQLPAYSALTCNACALPVHVSGATVTGRTGWHVLSWYANWERSR